MTVQHFIRRILILFFLVCLPVTVLLAASESYIQSLTGKIKQGDSCVVIDDKFLHLSLSDWNNLRHLSVDNIISFELRSDTSIFYHNRSFTCTLNVSVKYFTSRDQTVPDEINNVDLVVKYDTAKGAFYPADAYYKFKNAFKVIVVVNSITSQEWGSDIPAIFRVKNQILVERKYPFNPNAAGSMFTTLQSTGANNGGSMLRSFIATNISTQNNSSQLFISWNPQDFGNPEEYDIEWNFIDALSANGDIIKNTYSNGATLTKEKAEEWMRNDNTRVTVRSSSYTINLPYPDGFILVRIRGVSYQVGTNLRLHGIWDYIDDITGMAVCKPVTAHESGLNYQYTAAFAEEGKRKEVISYFDATLRERQAVTLNNSDKTLVPGSATEYQETATVQETIYDKMGRSAVSVLPAPTNSKSINYYQKFNINPGNQQYSHTDITLNSNCIATANSMSAVSGASKYYSPGNPFINEPGYDYFTKYVPDAQLYPYSLTEYLPDNTGRIRRQGGVGSTFQPINGRATQYFYGKPGQRDLDRLFGVEAGDCSHYLKNMIIDANGQATVSYIDANGKTIATALAGGAPETMDALPSAGAGLPRARINQSLIKPADFTANAAGLVMTATSTFMAAADQATFELHYSVNPAALITTHGQGQFCSNCYYDVLIEVRNDCGEVVASSTTTPFPINDVACNANAQPVTGTLPVPIAKRGAYTTTYTLRLSRNAINYHTDYYIENNSDLKKLQAFFEEQLNAIDLAGCYSSCEACKTLGNTPDAFRQKILDLLGTDKFNGIQVGDANSEIQKWITNTWTALKANCSTISCNATTACDDYLTMMKQQVKPGGQYAYYSETEQNGVAIYTYEERTINVMRFYNLNDASNTEIYNFNYVDDNGNTVYIRNLSESDFIQAYMSHPEWADMFVKKHIEYCSYLFCKDQNYSPAVNNMEASYNFDRTLRDLVTNGDDAVSRGYYNRSNMNALVDRDPFFNGGRGSGLKSSMISDLVNLTSAIGFNVQNESGKNIFQFIDWALYCKPLTNTTDPNVFLPTWTSCSVNSACRSVTAEWELYRNYYLQLKSKYLQQVKEQVSPGCTDCFIGKDAVLAGGNSTLLTCAQGGASVPACPANGNFHIETEDIPEVDNRPYERLYDARYVWLVYNNGNVPRKVNVPITLFYDNLGNQDDGIAYQDVLSINPGEDRVYLGMEYVYYQDMNGDLFEQIDEHIKYYINIGSVECPTVPNTVPSSVCMQNPNYSLYGGKTRVFNEFIDIAGYSNCFNANPAPAPTDAEIQNAYRTQAMSNVEDMRNLWVEQLKAVRDEEAVFKNITDNTINALADELKEVAKANIQYATTKETIRPASTIANGGSTANGFHSFEEVFNFYISSSFQQQGFTEDLLQGPYPYDKNPVDVNPNSGEINSTICANLTLLKNRYIASGFSGSFYAYLKQELEEDMMLTSAQLQDLEARCVAGCRYMSEPVLLPVAFVTPVPNNGDHPFTNCSRIDGLKIAFLAKYPGIDPTSKLYRVLFTNYYNHALGYALSYSDYIAFTEKCSLNNTALLYNKPSSPSVALNDFQCEENSIMDAFERAGQEYDRYITLERQKFRNQYISKCLANTAEASIEGEQYEYHYTLYYYDQSGNLVKTIPPEGVRFLTESQIDQVQALRRLGISSCIDDGITKVEDRVAALNTVSSILQGSTAKSIELWLSNIDAVNGGQARFITPDHKFMCQAAIANSKLWVELYSLQPGTSGDITISLSNQMVADISSLTLGAWSHVVVQSNGITANTWDVYLNGVKLTLISSNMPAYPFDWAITGGYTLPDEVIEPLKHIRLYSRLLSDQEVRENYSNPCFSITGSLQGSGSPLLIWGRFNIGSLCNAATETVYVPNQGALQVNANLNQLTKGLPNVTNNFTVEFWVKPEQTHEIDVQSQSGTAGASGQNYVIYPDNINYSNTNRASVGVSVGTNGVSVYEYANGYMPAVLVWSGTMTGWKHVAVVYNNNIPSLYINGQLVKAAVVASPKQIVNPSYNFGGGTHGFMQGAIDEVRIWSVARTAQEISNNYQQGLTPAAVTGLAGYWPMDPANNAVIADVTCNYNNITLPATGYNWVTSGSNINNVVSKAALNNFIVPLHGLPTNYAYNSLNQVIKQNSPDGGTSRFWYDRLGKLTVSQNAEQLQSSVQNESSNRYSYTRYDAFDRIVEVGEKVNAASAMTEVLARDNAGLQTWMQSGQDAQITQTIYDESPSYAPGLLINLRKRVAASIVLEGPVGSPRSAATYYSYDIGGNVKTLYQESKKLSEFDATTGIKRLDYDYDLISGKVNRLRYQEGKGDQFFYDYRYDADNRVIEASTSRDGLIWNTEAAYRYYLHGPLARTQLGHNYVQGLDYAYTLQGWLKGINSQQLDAGKDIAGDGLASSHFSHVARDVIGFSLGYFNGDYNAIGGATAFGMKYQPASLPNTASGNDLFNGNISNATLALNMLNNGAVKGYSYRYDQLNRLKQMRMHDLAGGGTNWGVNSIMPDYEENIAYDGNGNIETYNRNGNIAGNLLMDGLTYRYNLDGNGQKVNNKLRHVEDAVSSGVYNTDIDGQAVDYYKYDNIGNVINEGSSSVNWTLYGKIKQIANTSQAIQYLYDATGNRISKAVVSGGNTLFTFYIRDAQNNVIGVYSKYEQATPSPNDKLKWAEQHLYGSGRIGIWHPNIDVTNTWQPPGAGNGQINIGEREYELSNNLGNVLATISDSRTAIDEGSNGTIDYYLANVLMASDYYPFGMQMPGRTYNGGNYRYGFNGKENDNEAKGVGNQQDYGMRIYEPRIGKFLSVDPITSEYPELTPYQFASNRPIDGIDQDGLEWSEARPNNGNVPARDQTSMRTGIDPKSFRVNPYLNVVPVYNPVIYPGGGTGTAQGNIRNNYLVQHTLPKNEYEKEQQLLTNKQNWEKAGYNSDGSKNFLMRLQGNKTWNSFAENLALRMIDGYMMISPLTKLGKLAKLRDGFVRVGHWMPAENYEMMLKTGRIVAEPRQNGLAFFSIAGPDDWGKQAYEGYVYAEFTIARRDIATAGSSVWFKAVTETADAVPKFQIMKQGGSINPRVWNLSQIKYIKTNGSTFMLNIPPPNPPVYGYFPVK